MADQDSFLHLARPLGAAALGVQPTTAPLNVIIQPQVQRFVHIEPQSEYILIMSMDRPSSPF